MPYIPHTPEETRAMLETVGVSTMDDLFADIPAALRPKAPLSEALPAGLPEHAVRSRLEELAGENRTTFTSFLGAGFYDHAIPAAVDALTSRGEFYTAYTPYQPEASQGTLQAIFEYQTAVCRLMDMEAANASVYDGGVALFEAAMMAVRHARRTRLVVDEGVNPIYRRMLAAHAANLELQIVTVPHSGGAPDIAALEAALPEAAAILVQNPNFFGTVADYSALFAAAKKAGAVCVMSVYPVMQAVLKTPGAMGADIAVAEGQSLGLPLSFGGPYLGIMTCVKALARQMPGRIVGRTVDKQNRTAYVLTLQAREQHIRRQKATSNICSNQALCALRSLMHMSLLGPEGLRRQALESMRLARMTAEALAAIPGVQVLNAGGFANEFTVILPNRAEDMIRNLMNWKVIPGYPLGRDYPGMDNALLVCCTEKTTPEQITLMTDMLRSLS